MCEAALKVAGLWMNHMRKAGAAAPRMGRWETASPRSCRSSKKNQVAVLFASVLNVARLINLPFNYFLIVGCEQ